MTVRNPLVRISGKILELPVGDSTSGSLPGTNGTNGQNGGAVTIAYTFSTTTTDSDPGNGNLRLNNATQNAATQTFVDLLDSGGTDWTTVLDTFDASTNPTAKGLIRLVKATDATKWLSFSLTARTTATGYRKFTLTNTGSSAASPFANGDAILLCFDRVGDKGTDGTGFVLVEQHTASSSSSLDFTTAISSTYDEYLIEVVGLLAGTNGSHLTMVCSTNGGSSYDTGSNYEWHRFGFIRTASGVNGTNPDTSIQLKYSVPSSGNYRTHGSFRLCLTSGANTSIFGHSEGNDTSDTVPSGVMYGGTYISVTAVNAVRFIMSSGNIASGTIRMYGMAK